MQYPIQHIQEIENAVNDILSTFYGQSVMVGSALEAHGGH
jgi:phage baseplate assembly protein W